MIEKNTVLILGAGASAPYGFPVGKELRRKICKDLKQASSIAYQGLLGLKYTHEKIEEFRVHFQRSHIYSIDAFLSRRREFERIGKAAIAACLIQNEDREIFDTVTDDHWYQYLWDRMNRSWEKFEENTLAIVTFNYDRSLEAFLLEALRHSFGKSIAECEERLTRIPIIHVYGWLGALGVVDSAKKSRPFERDIESASLSIAANSIHLVDADGRDQSTFKIAAHYMEKAARICFLGFGFDPINLERLQVRGIVEHYATLTQTYPGQKKQVFATTLGLSDAETGDAAGRCGCNPEFFRPLNCEALLREFLVLR